MIAVYTATRNYYRFLRTAIFSFRRFHPDAKLYVLAEDDRLPFENDETVINVSGMKPEGVNARTQYSYMSRLRPSLARIIPERKVLYLDVDTVVCDDLSRLYDIDMTGKWWAAVPEVQTWYHPFGPEYYNNGVSVYNLEQMRADGIVEILEHELENVYHRFSDQDVMNKYAVPEMVIPLPNRFNSCGCCGHSSRPAIVHFAGIPNWYGNPYLPGHEYLDEVIRLCEG